MKKREIKQEFKFSIDSTSGPSNKPNKNKDNGGWSSDGVELTEK